MTDETKPDERCVACDVVWNILIAAAAVTFGLIALDYMTDGKVTDMLTSAFKQVRPHLAAVIPLPVEDAGSDAAG